ncbi:sigma-70 family RNA polymerase sigma factor [Nocardia sp. NPDC051570]|uniref:sigma-70 family RNA polymerase sigma factor n=1 Tax=Nocardia sp. NPDC051570 TaxID=3364324 RepID=UPI0037B8C18B
MCTDEGLSALLAADQGLLHWRAARRLGGDMGLAEHAVQETLLRAWRSCATYDPDKGSVRTWLLSIERNVLTDIARMRAVRPAETSWDELVDADTRWAGPDFTDALTDGLLVAELLAVLPPAQRDAVVQVILCDRAYQDVAADLGVPVGTVKTRVHYALRSLRRLPLGA